jgi:O-antigen ligase
MLESLLVPRGKLVAGTQWMLCAAAVSFPFSVAVANISLGIALAFGLFSGLLREGAKGLWMHNRMLALALAGYLALMLVGLLWSMDRAWGLHILGRQWFWLLVPVAAAALRDVRWSRRFLLALSVGLGLHLLFTVFQMLGWVSVTTVGSTADNPTGHIGHIGFGFVYGTWAAWLLYWGWKQHRFRRWLAWITGLWAMTMVFLAHGRSGYLITLTLFVIMILKIISSGFKKRHAGAALGVLLLVIVLLILGPGRERLLGTWQSLHPLTGTAVEQGTSEEKTMVLSAMSTRYHLSLWMGAIEAWKAHPFLGVGTGGFPRAAMQAKKRNPALNYGASDYPAHPHNIYLHALARWGLPGLGVIAFLLYAWIRLGWRENWETGEEGSIICLSGVALLVHGLTASSLEEHFSAVLAAMLLGAGLARLHLKRTAEIP